MQSIYIENLALYNYRNFQELKLNFSPKINIILGFNGVGKTNILESISLLTPGKGLKGCSFSEICYNSGNQWSSIFHVQSKLSIAKIENYFSGKSAKKREIIYNGTKISSSEFPNLLNILWLTPQMEDFFLAPSAVRRKFVDRLVYNFVPEHARNINLYEHLVKERLKAVIAAIKTKTNIAVNDWLENIEMRIADIAYIIAYDREQILHHLQRAFDRIMLDFPKAKIDFCNFNIPLSCGKEAFSEQYLQNLRNCREKDGYSGRSNFGIHKTDIALMHLGKNQLACFCSTGEQKALLISLMLAAIDMIMSESDASPVILFDEIFVHLDEMRKEQLADYLKNLHIQFFITANDLFGIEKFSSQAHLINL
jgi:DNA replication and repair protein RecF